MTLSFSDHSYGNFEPPKREQGIHAAWVSRAELGLPRILCFGNFRIRRLLLSTNHRRTQIHDRTFSTSLPDSMRP